MIPRCSCSSQLTPSVFDGLLSWQKQNRLKQLVLQLLAKELNEIDIMQLRKKFEAFDRSGSGTIRYQELKQSMIIFIYFYLFILFVYLFVLVYLFICLFVCLFVLLLYL